MGDGCRPAKPPSWRGAGTGAHSRAGGVGPPQAKPLPSFYDKLVSSTLLDAGHGHLAPSTGWRARSAALVDRHGHGFVHFLRGGSLT